MVQTHLWCWFLRSFQTKAWSRENIAQEKPVEIGGEKRKYGNLAWEAVSRPEGQSRGVRLLVGGAERVSVSVPFYPFMFRVYSLGFIVWFPVGSQWKPTGFYLLCGLPPNLPLAVFRSQVFRYLSLFRSISARMIWKTFSATPSRLLETCP